MRSILVLITLLFCVSLRSQCGTDVPRAHVEAPPILENSRDQIEYSLDRTMSVHIYIVATSPGFYGYSAADYIPIWAQLNADFEPIGLSFELCNETLIPNYNWASLDREDDDFTGVNEADEMYTEYTQANVINVYYIDEVADDLAVAGYAFLPTSDGLSPKIIVLTKEHGPDVLQHEMGHFLGLYHTFEESLGAATVDGVACASTGDLVCDTPADANGTTNLCTYVGTGVDANGDYYTPYLSNYMSYYPPDCKCRFTNGQYNRMAWMALNWRSNVW